MIELQKIGIYGGTFDPVHHAHLILARAALERFALERIVFVPTRLSPHKNASVATPEARLQMLRSAIEGEAQFEVDDCELQRDPPSYTIDTVEKLREKYSGAHLFLLIGDDNLAGLPSSLRTRRPKRSLSWIYAVFPPSPTFSLFARAPPNRT